MERTLIIAEAGVNHNGSLELALELCQKARDAGADVVKFQTFKTEKIITKSTKTAAYQEKNAGEKSQFDLIKKLELPFSDFVTINNYCNKIGIKFLSTPDDHDSLDFLVNTIGMKFIKIGSGEITNVPFLRKIGTCGLDVILSTGMATLAEVSSAFDLLLQSGAKSVALLHCTSDYPCDPRDVNLNAMKTLSAAFKTNVGYSDHTIGINIPVAAVALGAKVIEKHFTLDKELHGPDHAASLNPVELSEMVQNIRNIELALGSGIKTPAEKEKQNIPLVRRKIVALHAIKSGELFSEKNICTKRNDAGLGAQYWDLVIGIPATKNYAPDDGITF